jgi:hypothetical protein
MKGEAWQTTRHPTTQTADKNANGQECQLYVGKQTGG